MEWAWNGVWDGDLLRLNGLVFSVNYLRDAVHPDGSFIVHKHRSMVRDELDLIGPIAPKRILELGTDTGGSAVMWAELLKPGKLVTVDLNPDPLDIPVRAYRGVDQADTAALREIVTTEFDGELDCVLDDASHFYEPTSVSFECLFPLLRSGGLYVLEDWDWEVLPDQLRPASMEGAEGLVRLVAELSRRDEVRRLSLHRSFALVERA